MWEEYIWKITGWKHYGRGLHNGMNLFIDATRSRRYPDFTVNAIPIDTKYKRNLDSVSDYNQMITYMHIMKTEIGIFLQPSTKSNNLQKIGELAGIGGKLFTYYFKIPQDCSNYDDFVKEINKSESELLKLCR